MGHLMDAVNEVTKNMSPEERAQHMGLVSYLLLRMEGVDKGRIMAPSIKDAQGVPMDLEKIVDDLLQEKT